MTYVFIEKVDGGYHIERLTPHHKDWVRTNIDGVFDVLRMIFEEEKEK